MRSTLRSLALLAFAVPLLCALAEPQRPPQVARCELSGTVDAGSAAHLSDCVQRAERGGMAALLIRSHRRAAAHWRPDGRNQ